MEHDLVVIGGGLAGLTAGLYGARYGVKTAIIERMMPGGQIVNVERIEDYPGFTQGISGAELGSIAHEQAEQAGAEFLMDEVTALERDGDGYVIRAAGGDYKARAVIVAVGSSRRGLDVPGDPDLRGRGVSECAVCDGSFFVGKRVAVVGGGDSALSEACALVDQGIAEVLLVHQGTAFEAQQVWQDRIAERPAIKPQFGTEVVEIKGADGVEGVVLRSGGATRDEAVDGVFPYLGLKPATEWLQGTLDLDEAGHVVVDGALATSLPGVFAAGDIRQNSMAQLAASAGDGASAAVAAVRYLKARG